MPLYIFRSGGSEWKRAIVGSRTIGTSVVERPKRFTRSILARQKYQWFDSQWCLFFYHFRSHEKFIKAPTVELRIKTDQNENGHNLTGGCHQEKKFYTIALTMEKMDRVTILSRNDKSTFQESMLQVYRIWKMAKTKTAEQAQWYSRSRRELID